MSGGTENADGIFKLRYPIAEPKGREMVEASYIRIGRLRMFNPFSPLNAAVALGATAVGIGIGITIGTGMAVTAHAAMALEPAK